MTHLSDEDLPKKRKCLYYIMAFSIAIAPDSKITTYLAI